MEGNFSHYRDHHLAPELKAFKSFAFKYYKISVRGEGEVAVATETYNYTIVLANGQAIERAGVATSVLKWTDGKWQIISRSEEHTSELQSLMRISYAVLCLKKKHRMQTKETHRKQ